MTRAPSWSASPKSAATSASPSYSVSAARLKRATEPSKAYWLASLEARKYRSPAYSMTELKEMIPRISADIEALQIQVSDPPENWDGKTWETQADRLARWKALRDGMRDALEAKERE